MQEVNINFIILNLFYLRFCFWPDVCTEKFSFKVCGVVPWRRGVRNTILLHAQTHTHTHTLLSQHFTNNFSLHTTLYSQAT